MIYQTPSKLSEEELIAALKAENSALRAWLTELERRLEFDRSKGLEPPLR
jgi:hypothetical protein